MKRNFLMVECNPDLKKRLTALAEKMQKASWHYPRWNMSSLARRFILEGMDRNEKKNGKKK